MVLHLDIGQSLDISQDGSTVLITSGAVTYRFKSVDMIDVGYISTTNSDDDATLTETVIEIYSKYH